MPETIGSLKGIGKKTEERFMRLNIRTVEDLISYYPRQYERFETCVPIGDTVPGKRNAVQAVIRSAPSLRRFKNQSVTLLSVEDESGSLQINWFNLPYLRSRFKAGMVCVFLGTVSEKNGRRIMEHPKIFSCAEYAQLEGTLSPVYGLTEGLSNQTIQKAVRQVLENCPLFPEFLPEEIRLGQNMAELSYAIRQIHFPSSENAMQEARRRLIFDEFFLFLLAISRLKSHLEAEKNPFPMQIGWLTEEALRSLPFCLTHGQKKVWQEIERDMGRPQVMNRLVQGDVGSGKTILAFLAMLMAYENNVQCALMAPTEILANQHYHAFLELLEQNEIPKEACILLTGSTSAKEKREAYERIASGEVKCLIGTHALIQDRVRFRKLGLVITDEQHRFGVRQRGTLAEKGISPNVLVMSATPIPRTLAMILYGDLDISVLDELPARRKKIKNAAVDPSFRATAYRFIEKEIRSGHQAYIICPMVEKNEEIPCESVTEYLPKIRAALSDEIRCEMLHGRMKPKEKKDIMDAFARGEIQVLVSTTVVEVGVNVPNATVMLVENAERFGLAQLHQLRGRVGRGSDQSYCIFMQGGEKKEVSPRLKILEESNDGFYIAEQDLKLRGPGDLLGTEQSGMAVFQLADIYRDQDLLRKAYAAVQDLIHLDPDLELLQNRSLKNTLEQFLDRKNDDILL